ncbi:restriction endonuclease [Streptomyces sp. NPDC001205]
MGRGVRPVATGRGTRHVEATRRLSPRSRPHPSQPRATGRAPDVRLADSRAHRPRCPMGQVVRARGRFRRNPDRPAPHTVRLSARPIPRMSRRRRLRIRRPRGPAELTAADLAFAATMVLLLPGLRFLLGALVTDWPWLAFVLLAAGGAWAGRAGLARSRRRRDRARRAGLSFRADQLDGMGDRAFEEALRDLMICDGWRGRRVGGGGDQAADVIAEHPLLGRAVLQAKHTRTGARIGAPVLYAVNGTAGPVHRAHHAVVVTNGVSPATRVPGAHVTTSIWSTANGCSSGPRTVPPCMNCLPCPRVRAVLFAVPPDLAALLCLCNSTWGWSCSTRTADLIRS